MKLSMKTNKFSPLTGRELKFKKIKPSAKFENEDSKTRSPATQRKGFPTAAFTSDILLIKQISPSVSNTSINLDYDEQLSPINNTLAKSPIRVNERNTKQCENEVIFNTGEGSNPASPLDNNYFQDVTSTKKKSRRSSVGRIIGGTSGTKQKHELRDEFPLNSVNNPKEKLSKSIVSALQRSLVSPYESDMGSSEELHTENLSRDSRKRLSFTPVSTSHPLKRYRADETNDIDVVNSDKDEEYLLPNNTKLRSGRKKIVLNPNKLIEEDKEEEEIIDNSKESSEVEQADSFNHQRSALNPKVIADAVTSVNPKNTGERMSRRSGLKKVTHDLQIQAGKSNVQRTSTIKAKKVTPKHTEFTQRHVESTEGIEDAVGVSTTYSSHLCDQSKQSEPRDSHFNVSRRTRSHVDLDKSITVAAFLKKLNTSGNTQSLHPEKTQNEFPKKRVGDDFEKILKSTSYQESKHKLNELNSKNESGLHGTLRKVENQKTQPTSPGRTFRRLRSISRSDSKMKSNSTSENSGNWETVTLEPTMETVNEQCAVRSNNEIIRSSLPMKTKKDQSQNTTLGRRKKRRSRIAMPVNKKSNSQKKVINNASLRNGRPDTTLATNREAMVMNHTSFSNSARKTERPKNMTTPRGKRQVSFAVENQSVDSDVENNQVENNVHFEIQRGKRVKGKSVKATPHPVTHNATIPSTSNDGHDSIQGEISFIMNETLKRDDCSVTYKNIHSNLMEKAYLHRAASSISWRSPQNSDGDISLFKYFTDPSFSLGQLKIQPRGEKGLQKNKFDRVVFVVICGNLRLTVGKSIFDVISGDTFIVPEGNMYNLVNNRDDEARLLFFQMKQIGQK